MNQPAVRAVLGMACAAVVPAALLHASAGPERHALRLSAPPFGWLPVLAVQLAAAVPLGWVVAAAVGRRTGRTGIGLWGTTGLLLAALAVVAGPAIARGLDLLGAGFLARSVVRSMLGLVLVTTWLVPLAGLAGRVAPTAPAAIALALAPPLAFASRLTETRSAEAASYLETGRLARAAGALDGLAEIGSQRRVSGSPVAVIRRSLRGSLERTRRAARLGAPDGAPVSRRIEQALRYIALERLDEADTTLRPMAGEDLGAALVLAALDRDRGRWADCERTYRRVLDGRTANAEQLVVAYDGLAETLGATGRSGQAAELYREAASRLPRRAGYFALQGARHELDAGRPLAALNALSDALRVDPSLAARAEPLYRQLRVRTPACVLAPPKG